MRVPNVPDFHLNFYSFSRVDLVWATFYSFSLSSIGALVFVPTLVFSPFQGTILFFLSYHFNILLNPFAYFGFIWISVPDAGNRGDGDGNTIAFTLAKLYIVLVSVSPSFIRPISFFVRSFFPFLHHHRFSWELEHTYV